MSNLLRRFRRFAASFLALWMAGLGVRVAAAAQEGECKVEITVTDKRSGKPVPCRISLENSTGAPERSGTQLLWRDQLVCISDGVARLSLPAGRYTYEVERGPEYRSARAMLIVPLQD